MAVVTAAGVLRDAEHGFFAIRESGLARAREALAAIPGRLPDSADVAVFAGPLDARAITFFTERAEQVRRTANFAAPVLAALTAHVQMVRDASGELRCVAPVLDARAAAVARATVGADAVVVGLDARRDNAAEHGRRLRAGIRKELADHLYNYGRALPKHTATIRDSASRLFAREHERIDDTGAHTDQTAQRRLADDRRALEHITSLLAASDPRRRGWVLPMSRTGMVVRSARALALGDRLTLSFHDGAAGAVINDVPTKENA
jgi:exonuclease VII large subunit